MAAAKGDENMVRLLCDHGAPAAAADHEGSTPLHHASTAGVAEALLASAGPALLLWLNQWNDTALHEAAWAGRADVVAALALAVPSPVSAASPADVPTWAQWDGGGAGLLDEGSNPSSVEEPPRCD